jgi:germination protein M
MIQDSYETGWLDMKRGLRKGILLVGMFWLTAVLCGGCSFHKEKKYTGDYIFCPDANETKVGFENYTPKATDRDGLVKEYLQKLQEEPEDIELKKALPEDVEVDEYLFDDAGQLTLYFSSGYGKLKDVSEILHRAAIVKTLCQIDGVDGVQFYVAGQPLTDSNLNAVGYMTADSFIDNTGGETTYKQNATLNMYFSDSTGRSLVKVPVDITYDATIPLEQLAVEQLIKGPYSIDGVDPDAVEATIPENTELNKISVKENTCYVDFSEEFLEKRTNVSAEATIYSVVNTLVELSNINKVQFSINGEQVLLYNDTIDFGSAFERNLDLVHS